MIYAVFCLAFAALATARRPSEVWTAEQEAAAGIEKNGYEQPRPQDILSSAAVPDVSVCHKLIDLHVQACEIV